MFPYRRFALWKPEDILAAWVKPDQADVKIEHIRLRPNGSGAGYCYLKTDSNAKRSWIHWNNEPSQCSLLQTQVSFILDWQLGILGIIQGYRK